jgi:hypothetical protein
MALTSKQTICEQAQRIINGGNTTTDTEVTLQELAVAMGQIFGSVVRRVYFEGRNEGEEYINGDFIFTFKNIDVTLDEDLDQYYSIMPQTNITLPRDMGVYHVSLMKEQDRPFVPLSNSFQALSRGLEVNRLENRWGYYKEQDRIYFHNLKAIDGVEKIMMKLVAPLGHVAFDDTVSIPDDIQSELVTMLVQMYTVQDQTEKDIINDNVK